MKAENIEKLITIVKSANKDTDGKKFIPDDIIMKLINVVCEHAPEEFVLFVEQNQDTLPYLRQIKTNYDLKKSTLFGFKNLLIVMYKSKTQDPEQMKARNELTGILENIQEYITTEDKIAVDAYFANLDVGLSGYDGIRYFNEMLDNWHRETVECVCNPIQTW